MYYLDGISSSESSGLIAGFSVDTGTGLTVCRAWMYNGTLPKVLNSTIVSSVEKDFGLLPKK